MVEKDTGPLVALLRGVNVGGKNILPMRELTRLFEAAGCTRVKTYVQSGNVVFQPSPAGLKESALGVTVPVLFRTAAELQTALAANPYFHDGDNESKHFIMFLRDFPDPDRIAALNPERSPGDRFTVIGREAYLDVVNAAKTKLTNAWFDSHLKTISTTRNMRTVRTLIQLALAD